MSRRTWLLDANLLIALTHAAHVHHAESHAWFEAVPRRAWATCAATQLAFLRLSSNAKAVGDSAVRPPQALQALQQLVAHPQHEYWDSEPPAATALLAHPALVGHRQVTDAHLLALAAARSQCLATLDRGLLSFAAAVGLADAVELVSATPQVHEARPRTPRRRA